MLKIERGIMNRRRYEEELRERQRSQKARSKVIAKTRKQGALDIIRELLDLLKS